MSSTANWDTFQLKDELLRGIFNYGYETPSHIQQVAIPPFVEGRDLIAQAQSGTGKTGAFCIGTLQRMDENNPHLQAIILEPTRELATQTHQVLCHLSTRMNIKTACFVGGESLAADRERFTSQHPQIIVGTLGRLTKLLHDTQLCPQGFFYHLRVFVLDEADQLLMENSAEMVKSIYRKLPQSAQIVLFSATMSDQMHSLASMIVQSTAAVITVPPEQLNLECIQQFYAVVQNDDAKYELLKHLYRVKTVGHCIVYANSTNRAERIAQNMARDHFAVGLIHGKMDHRAREDTLIKFRKGEYRVLVSSDVTARGIDVQQVNLVVNYDLTDNVDTYLHRIGRSGRWGRKGEAINFVTRFDEKYIKMLEDHYGSHIEKLTLDAAAAAAATTAGKPQS